jgi:EAL domain-containing protein (putative c-di-GMP-specific phosphodiesterase class I)
VTATPVRGPSRAARPYRAPQGHAPVSTGLLLVVDDDADFRDLVSEVGQEMGLETVGVDDPASLIRVLQRGPSIVLLDLVMPRMDGIEVMRSLARHGAQAEIILTSGLDSRVLAGASSLASELGLRIRGTLPKPFRVAELKELLAIDVPVELEPTARVEAGTGRLRARDVARAIEARELVVHYQPQVTAAAGLWVSSEALVRWRHPSRGLLAPNVFLPLVRTPALGLALTYRVLETALRERGSILAATRTPVALSVNLHPAVLTTQTFPDRVIEIVEQFGVDAGDITLEVTEEDVAADSGVALAVLTRLRMRGFRLSIDDFGTGHSTLHRLHRVPFNELKIDRSFVRAAETDRTARAIVESSIALASDLDLTIVVEGVETEATWEWLAGLGVQLIQGFLVAPPLPASALEAWTSEWPQLHARIRRPGS